MVSRKWDIQKLSSINRGFTLIELLVVMAIIAILTTIGFLALRDFIQGGRDSKRQADLRTLQSYLEQYRLDLGFYPIETSFNTLLTNGGIFNSNTGLGSGNPPASVKTYMNQVPADPSSQTARYCYTATPTNCDNSTNNRCRGYTLNAKLERQPNGSYVCGAITTYNLQVTPP